MKNIVIWALVIVNVFFLSFFLTGVISDGARKADSLRDLSALYRRNGITLETDVIRGGKLLTVFSTGRDEAGERELAEALLGQTTEVDEGVIYTYNAPGGRGQAVFKIGGDFDITLSPGAYPSGNDVLSEAKKILKLIQIGTVSVTAGPDTPEGEKVTAVCAWNSEPVYNCRIEFTFKGGSLVKVSGKKAEDIQATLEKTDMSSPATALVAFLNYVKNNGLAVSGVNSVAPGYTLTAGAVAGEGTLSAVWRIDAEIGSNSEIYYVNTGTWKVEKA
jgi:hypothetical protein